MIKSSELILNSDGSIYHLNAKPGQLAHTVITVGDPDRVKMFEKHFEQITERIENREFKIITGVYHSKSISVLSTGIGTDNIDIAINELDALFNIDFKTRKIKDNYTELNIIRLGTSGAIRKDIAIDSKVISAFAIGFDGLLHFYNSDSIRETALESQLEGIIDLHAVYAVESSVYLRDKFSSIGIKGITLTAPGFYGPQSRTLRLPYKLNLMEKLKDQNYKDLHCTNLEMETAGIYGLSRLLGHNAISLNAILANRSTGEFSLSPEKTVHELIDQALDIIKHLKE